MATVISINAPTVFTLHIDRRHRDLVPLKDTGEIIFNLKNRRKSSKKMISFVALGLLASVNALASTHSALDEASAVNFEATAGPVTTGTAISNSTVSNSSSNFSSSAHSNSSSSQTFIHNGANNIKLPGSWVSATFLTGAGFMGVLCLI